MAAHRRVPGVSRVCVLAVGCPLTSGARRCLDRSLACRPCWLALGAVGGAVRCFGRRLGGLAGRSARLRGAGGGGLDGHQFHLPTSTAIAGTVMVRTRKVSSSSPVPMMKPHCTRVLMLANSMPNIEAAKMTPAAVITPPVELTVWMTPERMPCGDSSRSREISSRL